MPSAPSKPRITSKPAQPPPAAASGRVTRQRAAATQESSASIPPPISRKPSNFLAKGKEGFRKVSERIKDKEKEKEKEKVVSRPATAQSGVYTESLQAFLRIRPPPRDIGIDVSRARPYLEPQGDRDVLMQAPMDPSRPHVIKPPHIFSFDRVYPPTTPQSTFFTTTTLPLVEKLLQGENGLLFAYGVSNSGKSYTISGGQGDDQDERGLLPRSIDVVFNSIQGLESKANLRCNAMADVEILDGQDTYFSSTQTQHGDGEGSTSETVVIDKNYSYAVFVSYAEVYNEKIFDLLDAVLPNTSNTPPLPSRIQRPSAGPSRASSAYPLSGAFGSTMSIAAMANGGGGILKRQALTLKNDPDGNGKYIAGLKEVRVRSREDALSAFRSGQGARQVFGTLANRESSRSHGIFTLKVVRIHNGAPNDPDFAQVSRLAIVDLAGSERTRNTGTTGDRLKEAGNINKSLMVLGQCLETLRQNQQKMAAPNVPGVKKKLAMVPFRHSKLTEVFQNFFVGDGRAVMIVNVNPYDTGFDENAHVMRFSAVAREIQTTASNKVGFGLRRQISTQFSAFKSVVSGPMKIKISVPVVRADDKGKGTAERESDGFVVVEEELEVVEEDEQGSGDEEERDELVEHLFEQLREYKTRLFESEMRNAAIEVEVRAEIAEEMQATMQKMHDDFARRLQDQMAAGELKTDRKLDILSRIAATPGPSKDADSSYISEDTAEDRSMSVDPDESFASALDRSGVASEMADGRVSDVFLAKPIVRTNVVEESESDDDEEEVAHVLGRVSNEGSLSPVRKPFAIPPRTGRQSTVESEDILAVGRIELSRDLAALSSEGAGLEENSKHEDTDEEEEEDEDEEDSEEGEEDSEEGEVNDDEEENLEADEEDLDSESESDFTISSESEDAISSVESSPIRRATTGRRTTGSPTKPGSRSPVKKATPKPAPKPKVARAGGQKNVGKRVVSPLAERVVQDTSTDGGDGDAIGDEEDDDVLPIKSARKKRMLGKKVVTEDEMVQLDAKSRSATADVRRLVRGGI